MKFEEMFPTPTDAILPLVVCALILFIAGKLGKLTGKVIAVGIIVALVVFIIPKFLL